MKPLKPHASSCENAEDSKRFGNGEVNEDELYANTKDFSKLH